MNELVGGIHVCLNKVESPHVDIIDDGFRA